MPNYLPGENPFISEHANTNNIGIPAVPPIAKDAKITLTGITQSNDYEPVNINENIVQEPAPKVNIKEKEAAISPPIAVEKNRTTTNSRRLSKDMLSIDDEVLKAVANKDKVAKILSQETAQQLFEDYKKQLQATNKNVIYAQFCMMHVEVLPPDEVHIISPSALTDTYAKEERTRLIDFYRTEAQMIVRITMEIQEDEATIALQNSNAVMSKSEIFEAMAAKNPSLAKLKDTLGMQIEY